MLNLIPQEEIDFHALPARELHEPVCRRFRYGTAQYRGKKCHVAQWRDASGVVVAQKLRFADKTFATLGDKEAIGLFGLDLVKAGDKRIIITEGELDALAVAQSMGGTWPVVSLPQGASSAVKYLEKDLEKLESFKEIVLCFDEDEAGRKAVAEALELFTPGKVKVTKLPRKDACEMLQHHQSEQLRELIWNAPLHRPEGIVSGDDVWSSIVNEKAVEGDPYHWEGLNRVVKGQRKKELILLAGGTGSGKSTVARHIAWQTLEMGKTVGYVALEESVRQSALGIYGLPLGKPLQYASELPLEELREIHDSLEGRLHLFDHFGSTEPELLVAKMRFMAKALKCDVIFLDHVTIAISGLALENERMAIDALMTQLRSLVEETRVTLYLISHLSRPREGTPHEEGGRVRMNHLRGSQSLGQLPDIIIGANRNMYAKCPTKKNQVVLEVIKNRPCGILEDACTLQYDPLHGNMVETDQIEDPENPFPVVGDDD